MTPNHTFSLLRASTMAFLMLGIALILSAHGEIYLGQLTAESVLPTPMAGAIESAAVEKQLMIGMLLVILAFGTHLLFVRKAKKKTDVNEKGPRGFIRPAYVMK